MGPFTVVVPWVVQDVLVFCAAVATALFIVRGEEHPVPVLLEWACFVFLYAAVAENVATLMGRYGYGRSVVMVFNVPLSAPVVEYLVVWAALRVTSRMAMPDWSKPFVVGLAGMLFGFTLDPVAIRQVFATREGPIGRWSWFPARGDITLYGEPVYGFSGWMLLCGYAAAFLLLGRWWYRKSGHRPLVGYLYPVLAMLLALAVMVSPLSKLLLWLEPVFGKGSNGEWIMLAVHFAVPALLLALTWRGRMRERLSWREEWPVLVIFVGAPLVHLAFALAGGFFEVLWLVAASTAALAGMVIALFAWSSRLPAAVLRRSQQPSTVRLYAAPLAGRKALPQKSSARKVPPRKPPAKRRRAV